MLAQADVELKGSVFYVDVCSEPHEDGPLLLLIVAFFLIWTKKQNLLSESHFYSHVILQQVSISFSLKEQLFLLSQQREGEGGPDSNTDQPQVHVGGQ